MKKILILLCLLIIFTLPFGCDGCVFPSNNKFSFYRTIVQGEYKNIDLHTSPTSWAIYDISPPKHADLYQLGANQELDTYIYYHRTDTSFIGFDTTIIRFVNKTNENSLQIHTITINAIEDTTGN